MGGWVSPHIAQSAVLGWVGGSASHSSQMLLPYPGITLSILVLGYAKSQDLSGITPGNGMNPVNPEPHYFIPVVPCCLAPALELVPRNTGGVKERRKE